MNSFVFTGQLNNEPRMMMTGSGRKFTRLELLVTYSFGETAKHYKFNIKAWGDVAEAAVAQDMKVGTDLFVTGKVVERQYVYQGRERATMELIAISIGRLVDEEYYAEADD